MFFSEGLVVIVLFPHISQEVANTHPDFIRVSVQWGALRVLQQNSAHQRYKNQKCFLLIMQ